MKTPQVDVQWSVVWKVQIFKGHEGGEAGPKRLFCFLGTNGLDDKKTLARLKMAYVIPSQEQEDRLRALCDAKGITLEV